MVRVLKRAFRNVRFLFRRVTSRYRMLPDFIIVGAQKSGTSSLFHYLSQHPQIRRTFNQETHYFDGGLNPRVDTFKRGVGWYRANFPLKSGNIITGEASPMYLFHPLVPKRMHDLLPLVKLIVLLRNPSERAISHFFHEKKKGRESLPILEALEREGERIKPVIETGDYKNHRFKNNSYKSRGLYKVQLERFLEYFPRNRILVLSSEELFSNPEGTLEEVFAFLEVDSGFEIKDLSPQNIGYNRTDVDPDVYKYLDEYFAEPNKQLFELIERRFPWGSGGR